MEAAMTDAMDMVNSKRIERQIQNVRGNQFVARLSPGNPKGVPQFSPGLPRSGYPGMKE